MTLQPAGQLPSAVMLVDECYRTGDKNGPFGGYGGVELGKMLGEVGIRLDSCYRTWAVKQIVANGGEGLIATAKKDITPHHQLHCGKHILKFALDGLESLTREIESCKPNVIVAFGNTALFLLTGNWGISNWRGSTLECNLPGLSYKPKVIPTYPPSRVLVNWSWRGIVVTDLKRVMKASITRELVRPDYQFLIRPSYHQVLAILDTIQRELAKGTLPLSVDIETRSYHIACIGFSWNKREALCIPLMCVERAEGYWSLNEEAVIMFRLYQVLSHKNCQVIGQNFHYDAQYFLRYLLYTPNTHFDTMLGQHALFGNMLKGLDFLSSMYCEFHIYWKGEGKEWTPDISEDQLWEYNCKDCVITYEVWQVLTNTTKKMGMEPVQDFQQSLFYPVLRTMNSGIRIDKALRAKFAMTLFDEIAIREQWIIDLLGHPLNPKSSKQMQELFYGQLQQKPIKNRKTGAVSCDDEALRKIAEREPILRVLCRKISELRSLGVFLSTFVQAPLDIDGKMRCSFNIAGTETYRFASRKNAFGSGTNLQNIPKGGGDEDELELPNVRDLFIPDPGYEYFDIDLAAADLRVVVWESDCKDMKQMLREGLDPYTEIAKEFYHDPTITKKDPRRQTFKSFAHGTNYLGTAKGLAGRLGLSIKDAEATQAWYFGRFPEIRTWQEHIKNQILTRRMVQNIFGYRCYFFDRIEHNTYNEAVAWIPQSTVACLINRAYVNIDHYLPEVTIQLQVHDSLAGQYLIKDAERLRAGILEQAAITLPYADPLVIPVGIKTSTRSWGDCG